MPMFRRARARTTEKRAYEERKAFLKSKAEKLRNEILEMEKKTRTWGTPLQERVLLRQAINRKEKELGETRERLAKLISASIK